MSIVRCCQTCKGVTDGRFPSQGELPVCLLLPEMCLADGWAGCDIRRGWGRGRRGRRWNGGGWRGGWDDGCLMKDLHIFFLVVPLPADPTEQPLTPRRIKTSGKMSYELFIHFWSRSAGDSFSLNKVWGFQNNVFFFLSLFFLRLELLFTHQFLRFRTWMIFFSIKFQSQIISCG